MSVVERCPNCGTTQATAGECEACHEANVRFFCTNHEPGLWLAGRTCPQCDARPMSAPPAPPARKTPALPPHARPAAPAADVDAARARERVRPVDEGTLDLHFSRPTLWETLLRSGVLARSAPPEDSLEREPAPLRHAGGWLLRLVLRLALIAVLLMVAFAGAVYLVARSLG